MSDIVQNKLNRLIIECDKYTLRIESAYRKIKPLLPLTPETYLLLGEDDIEHIDQFLFRFSKRQDAIGQRFF